VELTVAKHATGVLPRPTAVEGSVHETFAALDPSCSSTDEGARGNDLRGRDIPPVLAAVDRADDPTPRRQVALDDRPPGRRRPRREPLQNAGVAGTRRCAPGNSECEHGDDGEAAQHYFRIVPLVPLVSLLLPRVSVVVVAVRLPEAGFVTASELEA